MSNVVKNYIYSLSYQVLVIVVPLITTPYVTRVLGAKGVGIFSYTNSIVQYFILFGCIGLNMYGQREIAYVQHDGPKREKLFWELVILRFFTVSVSLFVYFFSLALHGKYAVVYFIMSLDVIASIIDISWYFQGIEDFRKLFIRNCIVKIIGVVLIFVFVKDSDDLDIYVLCHSGSLLVSNLSMWAYVPKMIHRVSIRSLEIIKHFKPSLHLFIPQIAMSVYTVLDKTMIGVLTGLEEEVAYYEQGQKIIKIILVVITSMGTVMFPRVSNLFAQNEVGKVKDYLSRVIGFVMFLSFPMMFGMMAISSVFVPCFFGPGYDKVIPNLIVISPIIVLISMSNIIGNLFLLSRGNQKAYTVSLIVGCCTNFFLNLVLIPKFLSVGAAVASVLAEASTTAMQLYYVKHDIKICNVLKNNAKCIIAALLMFIIIYYLASNLSSSFANIFLCASVGILIYIFLLILLKEKKLWEVVSKVKKTRMR